MNIKCNKYHVYEYMGHIDWLDAIVPPRKVYSADGGRNKEDLNEDLGQVIQAFFAAGWEGDGEIGLIWIPDFIDLEICPASFIWHVKQNNNGTSFLACERKLNFKDLDEKDYKKENEKWLKIITRN